MSGSTPIAWLSRSRSVFVRDLAGRDHSLTSVEVDALMIGAWQAASTGSTGMYSWPSWSPDGRQLACFRMPDTEQPTARVIVLDPRGVKHTEVANLSARLPIYLFWSPDSAHIAVLSQDQDQLHLSAASTKRGGREVPLAQGSPLFFTWAGPERVAVFMGSPTAGHASRLALISPTGKSATHVLPGHPGSFCAPLWMQDQVVYVSQSVLGTQLVRATPSCSSPTVIENLQGLVAMIASPDGKRMLRAIALGGDGTPYTELDVIELADGSSRPLAGGSWLAFFWVPTGDRAIGVRVDTDRNLLEWHVLELDGSSRLLIDMYPTRDLGFYLRFFEQYSQSHLLVDPAGEHLLVAGGIHGQPDPHGPPRLWSVPLDGSAPEALVEGVFGVFSPV